MERHDQERLDAARRRLQAMVDDPFGGQVLRDLVPPGRKITVALASELCGPAVDRAVQDSGGLPAFLAVDETGTDALTLLVLEQVESGIKLRRPGDWSTPLRPVTKPDETLGAVVAMLRASNDTLPGR